MNAKSNPTGEMPGQQAAQGPNARQMEQDRRRQVVDVLADAVMDLLLAEVEKAARGGSDELSTC